MAQQIRSVTFAVFIALILAIAIVLFVGMPIAHAKDCSVAMPPNAKAHWSYRVIDGRKCWYEGKNNLSKALLQWPKQTSAQSPARQPASAITEKLIKPADPDACCNPVLSFEARWRGLQTRTLETRVVDN